MKKLDDELEQDVSDPSKMDLHISWILFKHNFKPFFAIIAFTFVASTLLTFVFLLFYISIYDALGNSDVIGEGLPYFFMFVLLLLQIFLTFAFSSSSYGLSYDIMSSGDMFAEFRGAFTYFRKFWWQYSMLSFISGFIQIIFLIEQLFFPITNIWIRLCFYLITNMLSLITTTLFMFTFPSITAQGHLKCAFKENMVIWRSDHHRVIQTILPFYLYFIIPFTLVFSGYLVILDYIKTSFIWIVEVLSFIILLLYSTVVGGLKALLTTRIYNSNRDRITFFLPKPSTDKTKPVGGVRVDSIFSKKK